MMHLKRAMAVAPLLLLAACSSLLGIGEDVHLGYLATSQYGSPPLSAPDTVGAGHAFTVTVTTSGATTCWRADETRVSRAANRVTITPFDREGSGGCGFMIRPIAHEARITFSTPGMATIVVHGRSGGTNYGAEIDIEKTVVVVPSATP
ncbi:MAG TPA: hypothetical protein VFH27_09520 [Longimicrobiaceae bacterium]|nr:hypothetical protein [Longimicrobiaceae bacterium]